MIQFHMNHQTTAEDKDQIARVNQLAQRLFPIIEGCGSFDDALSALTTTLVSLILNNSQGQAEAVTQFVTETIKQTVETTVALQESQTATKQ